MAGKSYTMDMTEGSIISKMIVFALPLMLSSVLQLLFNAADVIVVGRFAGEQSLAAVGSTGALINLLISVLMGLSVGANVLIARYYGAGDAKNCQESIQSSILFSLVGGAVMNSEYAEKIHADYYGSDAKSGVAIAEKVFG